MEMGVLAHDDFCGSLHDHHVSHLARYIWSRYLAKEGTLFLDDDLQFT